MEEKKATEKTVPTAYVKYDNVVFPRFPGLFPDTEKKFQEIRDMECKHSDVFLCTFPKAGAAYGGWFDYTRDWEKELDRENILSVHYEDMKMDLECQIMKIAKFLEVSCSEELAEKISNKCTFENLKEHRVDGAGKSTIRNNTAFYRRGEVGDWKNWFTVAQNERFNEIYEDKIKDSKLKFIF